MKKDTAVTKHFRIHDREVVQEHDQFGNPLGEAHWTDTNKAVKAGDMPGMEPHINRMFVAVTEGTASSHSHAPIKVDRPRQDHAGHTDPVDQPKRRAKRAKPAGKTQMPRKEAPKHPDRPLESLVVKQQPVVEFEKKKR